MFTIRQVKLAMVCLALGVAARSAAAQFKDATRPNTRGFFAQFGGTWSALRADSISNGRESGNGDALGIGVGFTPHFALVFDGGASFFHHGEATHYRIDYFDVGGRWHFPREDQRLVPYADLMFSGLMLRKDSASFTHSPTGAAIAGQHDIDCSCWTAGGGLLYYLTSAVAIDANAHWSWGNFMTAKPGAANLKPDFALAAQSMRLTFGIAYYPDKLFRWHPPG